MKNKKYYGDSEAASVSRKTILYLLLVIGLATIATVLIVVLSSGKTAPQIELPIDKPIEKPITMLKPVEEFTIDKQYAVDRLLYSTTLKHWSTHAAVDLKAEKGTEVVSVLAGTVLEAGYNTLDGGFIKIRHAENVVTIYKSLDKNITLKAGDAVTRGQVIGLVSDTMLSEIKQGAHLHFEVEKDGVSANPADYLEALRA